MINIKNCFIAAVCMMSIVSTAPASGGCPCSGDLEKIQMAVNGNSTTGKMPDSVVSSLNRIFILDDDAFKNSLTKENIGKGIPIPGMLDTKIDLYAKNFYQWYGQDAFKAVDIDKNKEKVDVSTAGFFKKYGQEALKEDYKLVDKAVNTEVKEYIDKSLGKKQAKTGGNNTNTSVISEKDAKDKLIKQVDEYIQNKPAQNGNNTTYPAMLNPLKVFNIDEVSPLTSNQTKEFISSIEDSLPTVRRFYFPPGNTITSENTTVSVTVPAYTEANEEKTSMPLSLDVNNEEDWQKFKDRYIGLKASIESNPTYRRYSLKLLSDLAIKSGLISNIAYMFKKREVVDDKKSKISLAEKERNMALEGLDPTYYGTKDEPLSIAALNLKTLHANNKMIYFMYQILRQIEYANYIQSLKSLQEQQITSITDDNDIAEIKKLIK